MLKRGCENLILLFYSFNYILVSKINITPHSLSICLLVIKLAKKIKKGHFLTIIRTNIKNLVGE